MTPIPESAIDAAERAADDLRDAIDDMGPCARDKSLRLIEVVYLIIAIRRGQADPSFADEIL